MKGLPQKCFAASAVLHGLLLVLVFIGSAFIPPTPKFEPPAFEMVNIPAMLVDEPNVVGGGGNPNAGPRLAAPPVKQRVEQPAPQPPAERTPPPVEPVRQPEPVREVQKPVEKPVPKPVEKPAERPVQKPVVPDPDSFKISEKAVTKKAEPVRKPQPKPEPSFDLSKAEHRVIRPSTSSKNSRSESSAARAAAEREAAERQAAKAGAAALSEAMRRVQGGVSQGTGSYDDVLGPGGAAYASYHLALRKIYEDAWIPPAAARRNEPIVTVEVTIGRNGSVLSRRIIKRSGRSELDRTVQNALNRVNKVPPFPSGSKDEKRTFTINFNLSDRLN